MTSQQPDPLRVAIIGASGIGKNHAAWFQKNGATVCAFAGSGEESVARTSGVLASQLGYMPRGYTDLKRLLQEEKPNAACIASPPERHFEHGQICIEHGVSVLCEKPLVYDPQLSSGVLVAQAKQLVRNAIDKNVVFATQMQYGFVVGKLCELAGVPQEEIVSFAMEMETKNIKPGRSHETIWIELAPHPLSLLRKLAGPSELDSIHCAVSAMETKADFQVQRLDGHEIEASIVARYNPDASTPLRRFFINGVAIDYAGRKNEAGEFKTYLSCGERVLEMPDLVDMLISNFLAACRDEEKLQVTGEDGARNVGWLLQILDRSARTD
jgi:predicted dehydrogenase